MRGGEKQEHPESDRGILMRNRLVISVPYSNDDFPRELPMERANLIQSAGPSVVFLFRGKLEEVSQRLMGCRGETWENHMICPGRGV